MFASRAAQRTVRVRSSLRHVRFQSQNAQPAPGSRGALTGGLAGGVAALTVTYAWYHFSGAKSAVQTARDAKSYVDSAKESLKVNFDKNTPDSSQVLDTFKNTAYKYAGFIPGGRQYVDSAFRDIEAIRQKHGEEVDNIAREAYDELRDASKEGFSLATVTKVWDVLSKNMERLASLAGDAGEDILSNHPELKEKLGGSTEQLKQLGQQLGPEAKKIVDETKKEISDVINNGLQADSVGKIWQLIQDKTQKIKQLQEQAFNKGWEQIKPLLEKNPKVKQIVDDNMDTLKQGNVSDIVSKVKSAVSSGDTQDLEQFLQQSKKKAQQFAPKQLTDWLESIPAGGEIISRLQRLQKAAQEHGSEAEDIAKDTISELKQVLDKNSKKVEDLYQSGKQEAKKEAKN